MKPIKNKWEKEFDSMYQHDKSCKPRGSQDSPPWMPCYHFILPSKQREELKSFISTLLKKQKQEIIGICEEMKWTPENHIEGCICVDCSEVRGHNKALSDLIKKIKEL